MNNVDYDLNEAIRDEYGNVTANNQNGVTLDELEIEE